VSISLVISPLAASGALARQRGTVSAGRLHADLQITAVELASAVARHGAAGIGIVRAIGSDAVVGRRRRPAAVDRDVAGKVVIGDAKSTSPQQPKPLLFEWAPLAALLMM